MYEDYKPQPQDTSGVDVSSGLFRDLIERVARRAHRDWMVSRRAESRGLTDEQIRVQYPMFKPWEALSDAERESPRNSAGEAVKLLEKRFGVRNIMRGYVSQSDIVDAIAENAHEVWAKQRMEAGWTWGERRDNSAKRHPMLKPYGDLPDSEKEYDRAYGRIAFSAIEEMKQDAEERLLFDRDVARGVWGLEPGSPEAKALKRFSDEMAGMWEGDQLSLVNRAIQRGQRHGDDVSVLQDYKGDLLSVLGNERQSIGDNLGKPGFPATKEEAAAVSREVAGQMRTSFGPDEIRMLGREGITMLRDAYVGRLKELGASPDVVASFSPAEGRRMKARKAYEAFNVAVPARKKGKGIK